MATMSKKICDLSLNDIKTELGKRKLDKTGLKNVLTERLKKALVDEGKDPNTFHFDVVDSSLSKQNDDEDELLANEMAGLDSKKATVNGKTVAGRNAENAVQGRVRAVPQVGAIGGGVAVQGTLLTAGGSGGHGQGEGRNEDDLAGNSGSEKSAKPNAGFSKPTTPAKGKKNQSSIVREGGDESFVVLEDDTVLNDIDADLLDSIQREGKAPDSTGNLGEAGDNKGETNKSGQDSSATTDASAKLVEKSDTKDNSKATTGSKDEKDTKTVAKSSAKPVNKDDKTSQNSRNLWASGLSSSTRATDLKALFSKHGKVVAAKVVTNARSPESRCFGLVTMISADDATKCIQHLHRTELHGRMISVERAKTETQGTKSKILPPSGLKSPSKSSVRSSSRRLETKSRKDDEKDRKRADISYFSKLKAAQEADRLRRREMFLEREKYKQRMIEKRQREEAFKIERERRRLREMREQLDRQHLETERLRLETERLHMEREQEKYRREQQRVLQERRPVKRRAQRNEEWPSKRPVSQRFHGEERFEEHPAHGEREPREFNRRGEEHRTFREERPTREGRAARDERHPRESERGPPRHDTRSEWKSEREVNRGSGGGSGGWSVPVERSKMDDGWDTGNMEQDDGWDRDVVLSQPSGGYAIQQGQMMTTGMGTGTVFIAQPAMQGTTVMMQSSMTRQNDSGFGMAAASVRRY